MTSRRIRIVHLVGTLDIGGLETVVCDLIRGCDRTRFEVFVMCLGALGKLSPIVEAEGVPVISLNVHGRSLPTRLVALAKMLRHIGPEIIHTHNTAPHINGALAKYFVRLPKLVHTKHGRNTHDAARSAIGSRLAASISDQIVAVSKDTQELIVKKEKVPARRVRVIWNGVDTLKYQPAQDPQRIFRPKAVHVARLNPIKNQAMMLRAIRKVVDALPEFQLEIIGSGPSQHDLQQLANKLQLESSVRFLGMRDDVDVCLPSAEIFLLSSFSEGICIALLEAMSCGLSAVVTDVGGNREVVEPGCTGILVPSGNVDGFARAILQLCANPKQSREMGMNGRRRIEDLFSLSAMIESYQKLYLELVG